MKCATHPDRDAAGYCRTCGKPLCPDCTRDVRGALYCEGCLAAMLSGAPVGRQPTAVHEVEAPNPAAAAALGFIPGLGAIYNGEYMKGLIHIAVFAGIISILNTQPSSGMQAFFGIGLACFYMYMPIEAYRTAKMKRAAAYARFAPAQPPMQPPAPGPAAGAPAGAPAASFSAYEAPPYAAAPPPVPPAQQLHSRSPMAGAVVLIVIGVLILLANMGLLEGDWLGRWWPLILIGIGAWLFWKRFQPPAGGGPNP